MQHLGMFYNFSTKCERFFITSQCFEYLDFQLRGSYITRASGRNIEQFYLSVYREDNRDIKLDAILVKENIDENNYILYHYTTDEVLFATLYISDNTLKDIKLEFDDENLVKTRSLASWYQCANDEYQNYKDFYENNHPIACDIGDLFFGACTVGGVLGSAIYCAF